MSDLFSLLDLPQIIDDQWYSELERRLGVDEYAEAETAWDYKRRYYVYVYRDITSYDAPFIYFGIGNGKRAFVHWSRPENSDLSEWIDYWKTQGIADVKEVVTILKDNLTQRQAAALECYCIRNQKDTLVNILDYWTPEHRGELSEDHRRHVSDRNTGRIFSDTTKSLLSQVSTPRLNISLFRGEELIKKFLNKRTVDITHWIRNHYQIEISRHSLRSTLSSGYTVNGFRIELTGGKVKRHSRFSLITRRMGQPPVLIKGLDGDLRLFISSSSVAEELGAISTNVSAVARGVQDQILDHTMRYLTNEEVSRNMSCWPINFIVDVEGQKVRTIKLTEVEKNFNLRTGSLLQLVNKGQEYSIISGKKVSVEVIENNLDTEVSGFSVLDDLPLPYLSYVGYNFSPQEKQFKLKLQVDGKSIGYGGTKHEDIAKTVAAFARKHQKDSDVIEKSKQLLIELKSKRGERTKFWRGHWENEENILSALAEHQPVSLNDWKEKHGSSYNGARKLGNHIEIFNKYSNELTKPETKVLPVKAYRPAGYWSKIQNILEELNSIEAKGLWDWKKKSPGSFEAARKIGKQKEYFETYLNSKKPR